MRSLQFTIIYLPQGNLSLVRTALYHVGKDDLFYLSRFHHHHLVDPSDRNQHHLENLTNIIGLSMTFNWQALSIRDPSTQRNLLLNYSKKFTLPHISLKSLVQFILTYLECINFCAVLIYASKSARKFE